MKKHFSISGTLFAIVAGLLLLPPAPTLAEAGDSAPTFSETVDVRVVNVEAVVTDRSGTRVLGLTPADFRFAIRA